MENSIIKHVQTSFQKVQPISDAVAAIFYSKLFDMDPSLKPLFKGDITAQGKKLMMMLGMAVNGLNNMETLLPILQNLGKRHLEYGVTDDMYDTVGAALLDTLESGLGEDFTPEVRHAWAVVYTEIAGVMKRA